MSFIGFGPSGREFAPEASDFSVGCLGNQPRSSIRALAPIRRKPIQDGEMNPYFTDRAGEQNAKPVKNSTQLLH